jgi:hypothetical protein
MLWMGRGWAWTMALIISSMGIITGLVTLPTGIIGVVLDRIVVYLLMRSDMRRFCGKWTGEKKYLNVRLETRGRSLHAGDIPSDITRESQHPDD